MTVTIGIFYDLSVTDSNNVWFREDIIFKNLNRNDSGSGYTYTNGSTSINYIYGKTTTVSEVIGETITQVRIRFRDSSNNATINGTVYTQSLNENLGTLTHIGIASGQDWSFSAWKILNAPSDGWTWNNVQNLEIKVYATDDPSLAIISYIDIEVTSKVIIENETSINIILKSSTNTRVILK